MAVIWEWSGNGNKGNGIGKMGIRDKGSVFVRLTP